MLFSIALLFASSMVPQIYTAPTAPKAPPPPPPFSSSLRIPVIRRELPLGPLNRTASEKTGFLFRNDKPVDFTAEEPQLHLQNFNYLGAGTQGKAYGALDILSQKPYVAKFPHFQYCFTTNNMYDIRQEIPYLKRVNMHVLVGEFNYRRDEYSPVVKCPYLIQELAPGLHFTYIVEMCKEKGFSLEKHAVKYMVALDKAMKHIEDRGIIHNDVHNDNVLFDSDDFCNPTTVTATMIDFGRSVFADESPDVEKHTRVTADQVKQMKVKMLKEVQQAAVSLNPATSTRV